MQVSVHYRAQLRRVAGCASERRDVDSGCSVARLVNQLAADHGEAFRMLLFDAQSEVHPSLLVFVGAERAAPADVLHDGDEVTILTPMAGG